MNKHTPGPWHVGPATPNGMQVEAYEAISESAVSRCLRVVVESRNPEADARLIATAPKLLNTLETLLERYVGLVNSGDAGNWDPEEEIEVQAARTAIAKAKGEG